MRRYPVLIAGGGPTGLALAIELGWRGVPCLLVEQTDGTVGFPTTNLVNTRTSEHLRRWGVIEQVRFAGFPPDYPRTYLFTTQVFGYELARFEHPANGDPRSRSPHSPEGRIWCPKHFFDDVTTDYLVACDGGGSTIRGQLGIRMEGNFVEGQNVAILFRSPHLLGNRHGKAVIYQITNRKMLGAVTAVDGRELWRANLRGIRPEQLPSLDPAGLVRDALGADVPFEILRVQPWEAHRVVAGRYRTGGCSWRATRRISSGRRAGSA